MPCPTGVKSSNKTPVAHHELVVSSVREAEYHLLSRWQHRWNTDSARSQRETVARVDNEDDLDSQHCNTVTTATTAVVSATV